MDYLSTLLSEIKLTAITNISKIYYDYGIDILELRMESVFSMACDPENDIHDMIYLAEAETAFLALAFMTPKPEDSQRIYNLHCECRTLRDILF